MRLLAWIGALAIIVAIALPIYFFGGFYNVAATDQHFNIANVLHSNQNQAEFMVGITF